MQHFQFESYLSVFTVQVKMYLIASTRSGNSKEQGCKFLNCLCFYLFYTLNLKHYSSYSSETVRLLQEFIPVMTLKLDKREQPGLCEVIDSFAL